MSYSRRLYPDSAAPNRAKVIRNNGDEIYKINLNKVKKGKTVDFRLMARDRVNIPESFMSHFKDTIKDNIKV